MPRFLICGSPRTGGNLLCDILRQTGKVGYPAEPEWELTEDASALEAAWWAEEIRWGMTGVDGSFGVLLHQPWWATLLSDPTTRYIYLYRCSFIDQGISHYIASVTGEWQQTNGTTPSPASVPFDKDCILRFAREAEVRDAEWANWFSEHSVTPFRIAFEDLSDQTYRVTGRVFDFLGIDAPIPVPRLKRQKRDLYDEFRAQLKGQEQMA